MQVVGADARGSPILGKRPYGLAVEAPFATPNSPSAARLFVASFDSGYVTTLLLEDPSRPGESLVLSSPLRPEDP
jgi:hypothetical protein